MGVIIDVFFMEERVLEGVSKVRNSITPPHCCYLQLFLLSFIPYVMNTVKQIIDIVSMFTAIGNMYKLYSVQSQTLNLTHLKISCLV